MFVYIVFSSEPEHISNYAQKKKVLKKSEIGRMCAFLGYTWKLEYCIIGKNEFIKYNDFPIWTYHFEFDFLLMGNFLKMFIMELFVFVIDMFNCLL